MLRETVANIFDDMQKELSETNKKILSDIKTEMSKDKLDNKTINLLLDQTNECLTFMNNLVKVRRVMTDKLREQIEDY